MKRRFLLVAIVSVLMIFAFVSCSGNVAPEDKLGTITFGEEDSRAVVTVVKYSKEVEDLVWFYKATKLDNGYLTGQTNGFVAVAELTVETGQSTTYKPTKGLSGKTLDSVGFSYGLWKIELRGYNYDDVEVVDDTNSSNGKKVSIKTNGTDSYEYKSTIDNFLVDKDKTYATAKIELGDNPTTKIEFGEITFTGLDQDASASTFTLSVTDKLTSGTEGKTFTVYTTRTGSEGNYQYSIDDPTASSQSVTIAADTLEFLETGKDIVGKHEMKFVLSQKLVNKDEENMTSNVTIDVALYTLKYEVKAGTTTTIQGSLVRNDSTGEVEINSVQDVEKLTISRALDVTGVTAEGTTAKSSREQTLYLPGFTLTVPKNTVIATSSDSVTVENEDERTGTADAVIGAEYVDASEPTGTSITIGTDDTSAKYELTLPAAQSNDVLMKIKWNYGKNKEIKTIVHNTAVLPEETAENTSVERYSYNKATGELTLYLKHASPLYVVTKEAIAKVGDVEYCSLSEAINGVSGDEAHPGVVNGGTVTLLRDVALDGEITVTKSFTLDMGRKTVSGTGKVIVSGEDASVVITNVAGDVDFITGVKINSSEKGDVYYEKLDYAMAKASARVTLTLLEDVKLIGMLDVEKDLTVDLNGKTFQIVSPKAGLGAKGAELIIKNGYLNTDRTDDSDSSGAAVALDIDGRSGGTLTLENVTMTDSTRSGLGLFLMWSLNTSTGNAVLNIKNSTLTTSTSSYVVCVMGSNNSNKNMTINIDSSTLENTEKEGAGLYASNAEVNISNGSTVSGESAGIEIGTGATAAITGSTIEATGESESCAVAISEGHCNITDSVIKATVEGIKSENGTGSVVSSAVVFSEEKTGTTALDITTTEAGAERVWIWKDSKIVNAGTSLYVSPCNGGDIRIKSNTNWYTVGYTDEGNGYCYLSSLD